MHGIACKWGMVKFPTKLALGIHKKNKTQNFIHVHVCQQPLIFLFTGRHGFKKKLKLKFEGKISTLHWSYSNSQSVLTTVFMVV